MPKWVTIEDARLPLTAAGREQAIESLAGRLSRLLFVAGPKGGAQS